jgi:hypothetical protein
MSRLLWRILLWRGSYLTMAYRAKSLGISRCDGCDHCTNCQHSPSCFLRKLPQVCDPFSAVLAVHAIDVRPMANLNCHRSRVIAKSTESGEPVLYIDGCATVHTVALRRVIFKWKKGFATISLGQIYHSMLLSQPPSRGTVPLSCIDYIWEKSGHLVS